MRLMLMLAFLTACGEDEVVPDGAWKVTLSNKDEDCQQVRNHTSLSTDEVCGSDCPGDVPSINETIRYELFYDGDNAEIDIDAASDGVGAQPTEGGGLGGRGLGGRLWPPAGAAGC